MGAHRSGPEPSLQVRPRSHNSDAHAPTIAPVRCPSSSRTDLRPAGHSECLERVYMVLNTPPVGEAAQPMLPPFEPATTHRSPATVTPKDTHTWSQKARALHLVFLGHWTCSPEAACVWHGVDVLGLVLT